MEVSELQAALLQCREDLALKEALLLATDAQLAAARQALTAAQVCACFHGLTTFCWIASSPLRLSASVLSMRVHEVQAHNAASAEQGELAAAASITGAAADWGAEVSGTQPAPEELDSAQPMDSARSLACLPVSAAAHACDSPSSSAEHDSCRDSTPAHEESLKPTSASVLACLWRCASPSLMSQHALVWWKGRATQLLWHVQCYEIINAISVG